MNFLVIPLVLMQVCWQPPTENVDGTPADNLAGFNIYWGNSRLSMNEVVYVEGGTVTCHNWPMQPGEYYFRMTAINDRNEESDFSNVIQRAEPEGQPVVFTDVEQAGSSTIDGRLVVGQTGVPLTVHYGGGGPSVYFRLISYDATTFQTHVLMGTSSTGSWTFTPPRAGLYELGVSQDGGTTWRNSSDDGLVFFFKLAAPSGGGID